MEKREAWEIMQDVHEEFSSEHGRPPTKKEWRRKYRKYCIEKYGSDKHQGFYDYFNKKTKKGIIRAIYDSGEQYLKIVKPHFADKKRIRVLLDQIENGSDETSVHAANQLAELCEEKYVWYYPRIRVFLRNFWNKHHIAELNLKVLNILTNIIAYSLVKRRDIEEAKQIYNAHKKQIVHYAQLTNDEVKKTMKELPIEKWGMHIFIAPRFVEEAWSIMALMQDEDLLDIFYKTVEHGKSPKNINDDSTILVIAELVNECFKEKREKVREQLYGIARRTKKDDVRIRALNLIDEL